MATSFPGQPNDPFWSSPQIGSTPGIEMLSNVRAGLRNNTWAAAQALGYGGAHPADMMASYAGQGVDAMRQNLGINDEDWDHLFGAAARGSAVRNEGVDFARQTNLTSDLSRASADAEVFNWLASQGYRVQTGQLGSSTGQQLIGPDGSVVSLDLYEEKGVPGWLAAMPLLIAGGGMAHMALGGAGAGAAVGTTGAGAGGAAVTTQGIGAAELAGVGLANPAPLAAVPATVGGGTAAATGGLSAAGLGLSNTAPLAGVPATLGGGGGAAAGAAGAAALEGPAGVGISNAGPIKSAILNSGMGEAAGSALSSLGQGISAVAPYANYLKPAADIASGLYGMNLASDARKASDPFAGYRDDYGRILAQLEANPSLITTRPGYQAGLEEVKRMAAAKGYYGSGNMATGLMRYSGDFYNQEANRLAMLAGAGQTPGAGQFQSAQLASQSLASLGYGLGRLFGD